MSESLKETEDEQQAAKLYRVVHYRTDGSQSVAKAGATLESAEAIRDMLHWNANLREDSY